MGFSPFLEIFNNGAKYEVPLHRSLLRRSVFAYYPEIKEHCLTEYVQSVALVFYARRCFPEGKFFATLLLPEYLAI